MPNTRSSRGGEIAPVCIRAVSNNGARPLALGTMFPLRF